ncbi:glycerophosphoryl diester phosphodiesterase [Vibrio sinensis]|uniref:Glycerophosphoryl diester phosphodiesterase n=1 Tax=Vibrio sinensis TaxID=2302434 RepID=A0A3A6QVU9_9VIBR|nr:glycerophosphodiester phosphodiesterase family protein [Vibrio sinensis]RJX65774.1 glycerophosphoryl diester phosphodiesterase [Vibrio sinensis]
MAPIIVGHRGVAGCYPENTRVSIEAAIRQGLLWVEVDIQPTQDDILVVAHDHSIERCSNGHGRIDTLTLEQLRQFDFGAWFSPQFDNEPIMTLQELLALAKQHNLHLNLEVKIDHHDASHVAQLVQQELQRCNVHQDTVLLSSFSHEVIRALHQFCPKYKLAVLSERLRSQDIDLLKEVQAFSCNLNFRWVNREQINRLHQDGYQVWCYTVNNPRKLKHLPTLDAIFSDFPQRFTSI